MFDASADFYDAIYSFKDYAGEAAQVAGIIRRMNPAARSVLDLACGTGEHVRCLSQEHGFAVEGVDLSPQLIAMARRKLPEARFHQADMAAFALPHRFDAVISLFSSIGYLLTLDRVRQALVCWRDHLSAGGVLVVEPWFPPDFLTHGRTMRQTGVAGDIRVERLDRLEIDGRISRLHFEYRVERPDGVWLAREVHELGLFTVDEMRSAFEAAGLQAAYDPVGISERGLWIAQVS